MIINPIIKNPVLRISGIGRTKTFLDSLAFEEPKRAAVNAKIPDLELILCCDIKEWGKE
jgi:hypothetical protein